MPNHIAWEPEGFVHSFSGTLTGKELWTAIEAAHADPRFDDAKYAIADFTACSGLLLTEEEAEMLSAIAGAAAGSRRRTTRSAFVVNDPLLILYVDRFIESPFAPMDIRRFSSLDEAKRWAIAG